MKSLDARLVVAIGIIALAALAMLLKAVGKDVPDVVLGFLFGSGLTAVIGHFFTTTVETKDNASQS